MTTGIIKENVHNVVKELIEQGYTNIQIKYQYDDMFIISYSRFN